MPHYEITLFGENDWSKTKEFLSKQDMVIISTLIKLTDEIIEQASRYISAKTILSDLTSIKSGLLTKMLNTQTGSVMGLHPVF